MPYIQLEMRGVVGILTICRPKALNALNSAVLAELSEAMCRIDAATCRCLIVTGSGERAFVAGADIAEMKDLAPEQADTFSRRGNAVMAQLEGLPIPTIAAVNGYALGGGCELALSCDIRLAAEHAVFALPEVTLGILPGYGGVQRAARLLGTGRAAMLAMSARRIDARQALAWGLAEEVHPADELLNAALRLAEEIAANAPVAVRGVKRVLQASVGVPLEQSRCLEAASFASCFGTNDQKNAMQAFVEKRKPEPFTGS